MKPGISLIPTNATSVSSAVPLKYDSGVKYDDEDAYYDLWYPAGGDMSQGEVPTISASAEKVKTVSGAEGVKLDSAQEKVEADSKQEDVKIKKIEEL